MNQLILEAGNKNGSQAAFDMAVELGLLSNDPNHEYFAGLFMYMGEGRFKNINRRWYLN